MSHSPTCAVIIVTHNSELHIHKAMHCLSRQTRCADMIVIADSGSRDTSYLDRYREQTKVRLLFNQADVGFCKGNNIAMQCIDRKTDYVFFLNPDAFINPDYLEKAIAHMENPVHKRCGALTGTTLGYDIVSDKPTGKYDTTGVFHTWYGRWFDRGQGNDRLATLYHRKETIPAICGAVYFARKKALDTVMLRNYEVFDNSFYMYKEDIDLSLRLRRKRWTLDFVPDLVAYHCRGWTRDRSKMPRELRLCSARNELVIHLRNVMPVPIVYAVCKYAAVKLFDI